MKASRLNGVMCRHAFNDAVEALSRVASYATSRTDEKIGVGEFSMIGPELCRKDLVILAISLRRLSELTDLRSSLRSRPVEVMLQRNADELENGADSSWNVIGNIIHCSKLEIFKSDGILGYHLGTVADPYDAIFKGKEIDAVAMITSEKHGLKILKISDFCVIANEAIEEMNDFMGDNGVFLGSGFDTV